MRGKTERANALTRIPFGFDPLSDPFDGEILMFPIERRSFNFSLSGLDQSISEEDYLKGEDPLLAEVAKGLCEGRHELDEGRFITVIRASQNNAFCERLEGRLVEALQVKEEQFLPDYNRLWLSDLPDNEKLSFLFETIGNPHPVKWDALKPLCETYLFDDRGSGASQLHRPVRLILQTFMVDGCPRDLFQELYGLSITALDKWKHILGRKSHRFKSSRRKAVQTAAASEIYWKTKLFAFTVTALRLYEAFQGEKDEFYAFYLDRYLETGIFRPDLIQPWNSLDEEAVKVTGSAAATQTRREFRERGDAAP